MAPVPDRIRRPAFLPALLLAGLACAHSPRDVSEARGQPGCFVRHIDDAIALNEARLPIYAAWTGGRSVALSKRLIARERMTRVVARLLDWRAAGHRRRGVPLLCDELVDMSHVPAPALQPPPSEPVRADPRRTLDLPSLRQIVRRDHGSRDFDPVAGELRRTLKALGDDRRFDCMTRHILESALRAATLAPSHIESARLLGAESPAGLSWLFVKLHLYALDEAIRLDELARPFQLEGAPIICADVPAIPEAGPPGNGA